MPVNPFANIQDSPYVSLRTGLPLDEMKSTGDVLQNRWEVNKAGADKLESSLSSVSDAVNEKDRPVIDAYTKVVSEQLAEMAKSGDYHNMSKQVNKLVVDFTTRVKPVIAVNEKVQTEIAGIRANNKISAEEQQQQIEDVNIRYQGMKFDDKGIPITSNYTPGYYTDTPNFSALAQDKARNWNNSDTGISVERASEGLIAGMNSDAGVIANKKSMLDMAERKCDALIKEGKMTVDGKRVEMVKAQERYDSKMRESLVYGVNILINKQIVKAGKNGTGGSGDDQGLFYIGGAQMGSGMHTGSNGAVSSITQLRTSIAQTEAGIASEKANIDKGYINVNGKWYAKETQGKKLEPVPTPSGLPGNQVSRQDNISETEPEVSSPVKADTSQDLTEFIKDRKAKIYAAETELMNNKQLAKAYEDFRVTNPEQVAEFEGSFIKSAEKIEKMHKADPLNEAKANSNNRSMDNTPNSLLGTVGTVSYYTDPNINSNNAETLVSSGQYQKFEDTIMMKNGLYKRVTYKKSSDVPVNDFFKQVNSGYLVGQFEFLPYSNESGEKFVENRQWLGNLQATIQLNKIYDETGMREDNEINKQVAIAKSQGYSFEPLGIGNTSNIGYYAKGYMTRKGANNVIETFQFGKKDMMVVVDQNDYFRKQLSGMQLFTTGVKSAIDELVYAPKYNPDGKYTISAKDRPDLKNTLGDNEYTIHKLDTGEFGVTSKKGNTTVIAKTMGEVSDAVLSDAMAHISDPKEEETTTSDINLADLSIEGLSAEALSKVSNFIGLKEEGLRLDAYKLDDKGITIGYGHWESSDTTKYQVGDKITKEEATTLFKNDLQIHIKPVLELKAKLNADGLDLNDNQLTALASLKFNVGSRGGKSVMEAADQFIRATPEDKTARMYILREEWMKLNRSIGDNPTAYQDSLSHRREREFNLFVKTISE